MKKQIVVIAMLATGAVAQAKINEKDNIPAVVKESFKKLHPEVTKVKWEKDEGNYEAEYTQGKKEWEIEFDAKGNLIKSELELKSVKEFPQAVQNVLAKEYAKSKPEEPELVTLANGQIVYEVDVKIEGKKYELQFDETGKLIAKIDDEESK